MEDIKIITDEPEKKADKKQNIIFAILMTILIALVIVLVTFTFICAPVVIKGDSMNPSLFDGDIIMISKIHKTPVLGGIIVYKKPQEKKITVIKRVVGVAGDIFCMEKNEYNDDILIKQNDPDKTEYILSPSQHLYLKRYYGETIEIKEGEVFTIGDNTTNSIDGRNYGTIQISEIIGIKIN